MYVRVEMSTSQLKHGRATMSDLRELEIGNLIATALEEALDWNLDEPSRKDTPFRFARYLLEFHQPIDLAECLGKKFAIGYDPLMVIQSNIPFRMICEHHLLPAIGKATLGYIPNKWVVGLSKLTRLVQAVGVEKPSLQENICERVCTLLDNHIQPKGTMCVIQAEHGCMNCRGVNSPGIVTISSSIKGVFFDTPAARSEFLTLAGLHK